MKPNQHENDDNSSVSSLVDQLFFNTLARLLKIEYEHETCYSESKNGLKIHAHALNLQESSFLRKWDRSSLYATSPTHTAVTHHLIFPTFLSIINGIGALL